jgi:nucleotide-binding universal stress UspA family protein
VLDVAPVGEDFARLVPATASGRVGADHWGGASMKRYKKIVVAATLDDRDLTTLAAVARIAQVEEATDVHIVYIAPLSDTPGITSQPEWEEPIPTEEEIRQRLQSKVESQPEPFPPATRIQYTILQGDVVSELLHLAAHESSDLVCVGRWSPRAQDPFSLSVVRMVRKATCSVLVATGIKKPRCERLLVPIDFSEHSREALDVALGLAAATEGAAVTVQHVCQVPAAYRLRGRTYDEYTAIMKSEAQRLWEGFSGIVDFYKIPVTVRYDRSEDVPTTILDVADELDSDMIVLGSRGLTRGAGLLLGHVTDEVCARAARSTLVVKRKGEVVNFLRALLKLLEFESN